MASIGDLQKDIKNGRLALEPRDFRRKAEVFGGTTRILGDGTPAAKIARELASRGGPPAPTQTPKSTTIQVGEAPDGFGKYVAWDQNDQQLALVVFLNAADPLGVGIQGVTAGDTLELVSAVGLASFDEEIRNEGVSAFIGILAAGGELAAAAFGAPEAAPLIQAGANFAKEKFKEEKVRTKVRDAYGEDPGSHHKARTEGGVLICKPEAHGIYYSGSDSRFWIKAPGNRIDSNRPEHLGRNANFIRRGMGRTQVREDGDLYLVAWDFNFVDNFGFYELHIIMRRENPPPKPNPPVVE